MEKKVVNLHIFRIFNTIAYYTFLEPRVSKVWLNYSRLSGIGYTPEQITLTSWTFLTNYKQSTTNAVQLAKE